jgi:hypothetical protein
MQFANKLAARLLPLSYSSVNEEERGRAIGLDATQLVAMKVATEFLLRQILGYGRTRVL